MELSERYRGPGGNYYLSSLWDNTVLLGTALTFTAVSMLLSGCSKQDREVKNDYRNGEKDVVEIEMVGRRDGFEFRPEKVYLDREDKVQWISREGFHTATPYDGEFPEEVDFKGTRYLGKGERSEIYDFEVEGEYDYYCIPHKDKGMKGGIVVGYPSTED